MMFSTFFSGGRKILFPGYGPAALYEIFWIPYDQQPLGIHVRVNAYCIEESSCDIVVI